MFSWISNLFGSDDETRDWPEVRVTPLTLDLTRQTINGVRLGDPANKLKLLGRPKLGKSGTFRYYDYPTLGLQACADGPKGIVSVGVALSDVEPSIPPAESLTVVLNSRSVHLKPGSRLQELKSALGVQPKEATDDEDLIATLQVGGFECTIDCAADGLLQWIELYPRE